MIKGGKIKLRSKRLPDARNDYAWQTDPELTQLDATPLLTMTFAQYLSEYTGELRYPSSARQQFAIETLEGRHIGNCIFYGIDKFKSEAELGIMIGDRDYWDKGYGTDAVTTLVDYIFSKTNLKRLYLKTLESNLRAQRCFQKCSFTPSGPLVKDGFSFVRMELHRQQRHESQREAKPL